MNRTQVFQEMEAAFGFVPMYFKTIPETTIEPEWQLYKKQEIEDTVIPHKYKELIGLTISAVTKCKYCLFYHTEMAKAHGATEAEIEDAVHFAKFTTGWSNYVTGMQMDFDQFKQEVQRACQHVKNQQKQPVGAGRR